jgi:hypothetical protein
MTLERIIAVHHHGVQTQHGQRRLHQLQSPQKKLLEDLYCCFLYLPCHYCALFLPPVGFEIWHGGIWAYNRYIPDFNALWVGFFY